MIYPILGLILVLFPCILIGLFKNKINGFVTIFSALVLVHMTTALVTQGFNVFTYSVLISIHSVIAIVALYIYIAKRVPKNVQHVVDVVPVGRSQKYVRICIQNWFLIGISVLGLCVLYSIRFDYTGPVDTAFGVKYVTHSSYTYPLYSDEWVGASLVQYSINEKSLPLVNPLYKNEPFINFLMASHSIFAELIVVLSLNPFSQYTYLASVNSILLCLSIFLLTRLMRVRTSIAILSAISVLFITNSGNLPGTWFLLPYTASLTMFLFSIIGYVLKNRFVLLLNTILALLLYPPMIVFIAPFLLGISFENHINIQKMKYFSVHVVGVFVIALSVVVLFSLQYFSFEELLNRAFSFIHRERLDNGKVVFDFWNIIPLYIVPFIPFGLYTLYKDKKRFLLAPLIIGIGFWIYYSFTTTVFLIEPSRIIIITTILFLMVGGLGMERIYAYMSDRTKLTEDVSLGYGIKIIVFIFFVFISSNFSKFALWHKLPLHTQIRGEDRSFVPAPPITRYLHEDDVTLFQNYTKKIFISPPWKGLVIGAVTGNYPLDSKASTLTNHKLLYIDFMNENCEGKSKLVQKYKIDLIYSTSISCPGLFEHIGMSREGLFLDKIIKK
jgi:hypothetical protein